MKAKKANQLSITAAAHPIQRMIADGKFLKLNDMVQAWEGGERGAAFRFAQRADMHRSNITKNGERDVLLTLGGEIYTVNLTKIGQLK